MGASCTSIRAQVSNRTEDNSTDLQTDLEDSAAQPLSADNLSAASVCSLLRSRQRLEWGVRARSAAGVMGKHGLICGLVGRCRAPRSHLQPNHQLESSQYSLLWPARDTVARPALVQGASAASPRGGVTLTPPGVRGRSPPKRASRPELGRGGWLCEGWPPALGRRRRPRPGLRTVSGRRRRRRRRQRWRACRPPPTARPW